MQIKKKENSCKHFHPKENCETTVAKIKNVPKDALRNSDIYKNAYFNHSAHIAIKRGCHYQWKNLLIVDYKNLKTEISTLKKKITIRSIYCLSSPQGAAGYERK